MSPLLARRHTARRGGAEADDAPPAPAPDRDDRLAAAPVAGQRARPLTGWPRSLVWFAGMTFGWALFIGLGYGLYSAGESLVATHLDGSAGDGGIEFASQGDEPAASTADAETLSTIAPAAGPPEADDTPTGRP